MKCSGCLRLISKEDYVSCSSKSCNKILHTSCVNACNLTASQKEIWKCPDCQINEKKGGDNSKTPVRYTDNITQRKKINADATVSQDSSNTNHNNLEMIATEIRSLRQDMANMQSEFSKRFDDLVTRFKDYDVRINILEEKERQNEQLKVQVAQLQEQLQKVTSYSLRSQIEILGLPETPNENPYHLVQTTAIKIGIELDERDLDYASRAGPPNKNSDQLPRPLVVTFTRRLKKEQFLREAKTRRTINSKDIVNLGIQRKVYIHERLTTECRQLFRATRTWIREHGYKYCWVRNGSIYIRKREGREGSPPILIRYYEDLQKLSKERQITNK